MVFLKKKAIDPLFYEIKALKFLWKRPPTVKH